MTYLEFQQQILHYLTDALSADTRLIIQPILKNNQVQLDGLTILENGCNISPTIYLNYYYEELQKGASLAFLQQQILNTYLANKPTESIDVSFYTSYGNVSERILFKLIRKESNEELLSQIPHIDYLDLAVVFYCLVTASPAGSATILIRNEHLRFWNVTTNDLYELALKNTPRLFPPVLHNITEIVGPLLAEPEFCEYSIEKPVPMYVLTNTGKLYGAACLLYPDLFSSLSDELHGDFYILPSSVHEVILLSVNEVESLPALNAMIHDINETQLDPEEILSDHAYLYSVTGKKLSLPPA